MTTDARAAEKAAEASLEALDQEAREHKRLAGFHRRKAREARERQRTLTEAFRVLGIGVRIIETSGGAQRHGDEEEG